MIWFWLGAAFKLWMVIDCYRRGAERWWYFVILMPLGAWAYFFLVKLKDFRLEKRVGEAVGESQDPLPVLRHRAEQTPSVQNLVALGRGLERAKHYSEAAEVYTGVLARDKREREALYGLASSLRASGQLEQALTRYAELMDLDPQYHDYSAALEYGEALWEKGEREDALELFAALAEDSKRLNHRLAHAHYLAETGKAARARQVLEQALTDYEGSPDFVRRRDKRWAERARRQLTEL